MILNSRKTRICVFLTFLLLDVGKKKKLDDDSVVLSSSKPARRTISFLSAMQSIPADLNEAAAVDGAGMFTRFFKITLPQLKSVSLVIVFIHIIWTAINFDFIWVMTEGGPNYATETLPIMIYRYSMKTFDVGAASALSTMMFTAMFIMFLFYYRKRMKISDDLS